MMKKIIFLLAALSFLTLAVSCVSRPQLSSEQEKSSYPQELYVPEAFNWQPVCNGIERFDFENNVFPVRYHVVKIDLDTPNLELACFPDKSLLGNSGNDQEPSSSKKGSLTKVAQPFVYKGIRTSTFAQKYGCVVAMNATPFGGKNGKWNFAAKIGNIRQLVGVHRIDGVEFSAPNERYSALAFAKAGATAGTPALRAAVVEHQTEAALSTYTTCFGGFFTILSGGEKKQFAVQTHDSRSGAGVSENGRFLYLLAVEGETPSLSEGLSYPQCADIFKAMGCTDALEFDGGSSTDLCINGKSVLSYPFTFVEGNSFGFRFRK